MDDISQVDNKEETSEPEIKAKTKRYDDSKGDTLFIRNVSRYDTDEEGLKNFMEENFGETQYCLICRDKETGESRGTAFVKFKDPASATKCLQEFKNLELQYKFFLNGRNLYVLPALSRDEAEEVKNSNAKSIKLDEQKEKKRKKKKARHLPREKFFASKKPASVGPNSETNAPKRSKKDLKKTKTGNKNKNKISPVSQKNNKKAKTKQKSKAKVKGVGKGKKMGANKKRWRHVDKKVIKS